MKIMDLSMKAMTAQSPMSIWKINIITQKVPFPTFTPTFHFKGHVSNIFPYFPSALKEDDPKEALKGFEKVVTLETEKGEWGFKALKQMVKLTFKMGLYTQVLLSLSPNDVYSEFKKES